MFRVFCGAYLDTGEGRHRRRELEFGDRRAHRRSCSSWRGSSSSRRGRRTEYGASAEKSWLFLVLSGLATGASWLFYFKALQIGEASKVIPVDKFSVVLGILMAFIFLHEAVTAKTLIGGALIAIGTFVLIL